MLSTFPNIASYGSPQRFRDLLRILKPPQYFISFFELTQHSLGGITTLSRIHLQIIGTVGSPVGAPCSLIPARAKYINLAAGPGVVGSVSGSVTGQMQNPPLTAHTSTLMIGTPPVLAVLVNITLPVHALLPCDTKRPIKPDAADESRRQDKKHDDKKGRRGLLRNLGSRILIEDSFAAAAPAPGPEPKPAGTSGAVSLVTYLFTNATSVLYGDTLLAIPIDGVKFSVEVYSWPFCGESAAWVVGDNP